MEVQNDQEQSINPVDTLFCTNCGQPLYRNRVCPQCNAKRRKNYKKCCRYCGSQIENKKCVSCGCSATFNPFDFIARLFVWICYIYALSVGLFVSVGLYYRSGPSIFAQLPAIIIAVGSTLLMLLLFKRRKVDALVQKLLNHRVLRKVAVGVLYIALAIVFVIGSTSYYILLSENYEGVALGAARNELVEHLKNPDSLQIHDISVSTRTAGARNYYYITIDYSAQNGFGGYNRDVRETYWCVYEDPVTYSVVTEKISWRDYYGLDNMSDAV